MASILISNFGDTDTNGLYTQYSTHDGYAYYKKNTNDYIIIYRLENGPWSYAPAYWIEKVSITNNSVPKFVPKYKATDTTNVVTATWVAIQEITSGELTVGSVNDVSSSSSSSSMDNYFVVNSGIQVVDGGIIVTNT